MSYKADSPLTIDELLNMEGKPVYDGQGYEWHVIRSVTEIEDGKYEIDMTDYKTFEWNEQSDYNPRLYRTEPIYIEEE